MHRSNGTKIVVGYNNEGNGGVDDIGTSSVINGPLDALPKQFVVSMKTLFDILDDQKTGFVLLSDIERGFDQKSKDLPHGVIDSLRRVTPSNGLLSFERFCAGLKICLLRNQIENKNRNRYFHQQSLLTTAEIKCKSTTLRPSNNCNELDINYGDTIISHNSLYGAPPKPPRILLNNNNCINKSEIRLALHEDSSSSTTMNRLTRGTADGGSNDMVVAAIFQQQQQQQQQQQLHKKEKLGETNTFQRRFNVKPRRHTLQNGIDYKQYERLKQYEEVLLQGLTAIEQAKEWYLNQISNVQEKIKCLGKAGTHSENWSEAHQEYFELQRVRILELNRHIKILADSWERNSFPLHMNLAVRHSGLLSAIQPNNNNNNVVICLKQKNRQLTEEVNQKSERITMLEREKQVLLHDLMQLQRSFDLTNTTSNTSNNLIDDCDIVF